METHRSPLRNDSSVLTSKVQALFQEGLAHHQKGRLAAAEENYRECLALMPDYFDALHLLGVACYRSGRPGEGIDLLDRALSIRSDSAAACNHRGNALRLL